MHAIADRLNGLRISDFVDAVLDTLPRVSGIVTVRSDSYLLFPYGEIPAFFGEAVAETIRDRIAAGTSIGAAVATIVIRRVRKACERLRMLYGISETFDDDDTLVSLRGEFAESPETPRAIPDDYDLVIALSLLGAVFGPLAETYEFLLRDGLRIDNPKTFAGRVRSTIA